MLYFIYWLFKFIEASAANIFFEMEVAEKTFKMEIFCFVFSNSPTFAMSWREMDLKFRLFRLIYSMQI